MQGHKTKVVLEIKERSKEDINSSQVRKSFSYLFVSVKLATTTKEQTESLQTTSDLWA